MSEINVTPFVDVMLVLLIIFMVAAPLLTVGVPVELPDRRAGAALGDRGAADRDAVGRRHGAIQNTEDRARRIWCRACARSRRSGR